MEKHLRSSFYSKNNVSKEKGFRSKLSAKHRNKSLSSVNKPVICELSSSPTANKVIKTIPSSVTLESNKLTPLQEKLKQQLDGARFRWLNERLYKSKGSDMYSLFKKEPELFDLVC
jgi:hypothetical protein